MKLFIVLLCIWCVPAHARDPKCAKQNYLDVSTEPDYNCPSPGEDVIVPPLQLMASVTLDPNDSRMNIIPWAGILMDKNRVLMLGMRIKALRRLRYLDFRSNTEELTLSESFLQANCKINTKLAIAQRDNYKKRAISLNAEIAHRNKWYRSGPFWFATGVVTAAAGAIALVFATR